MPGPRRRPTAIEERLGSPKKQRKNRAEPKPDALGNLTPPAELDKIAKAEWRRAAPLLRDLGLLTVADVSLFSAYCQAVSDFTRAGRLLKESLLKDGRLHPAYHIKRAAFVQIIRACAEFGMSPSSRGRMVVDPDAARTPQPKSKLMELLDQDGDATASIQ